MAQVWDGTIGDRLYVADPGGFSINTGQVFSACGWATSTTTAGKCLFCLSDPSGGVSQFALTHRAASANLVWYGWGTAQLFADTAITDDGAPFFWAVTTNGLSIGSSTFYIYRPGTGWTSSTNTVALQAVATVSVMSIGNNGTSTQSGQEPWVGRTFNTKAWAAELTQQEIYAEMESLRAVRTQNLLLDIPGVGTDTATAFRDYTGRAWTMSGTITYNDTHPGVPYGPAPQLGGAVAVTYSFARPASDITTGWTTSSGTSHYALIDEETASDADYIYATAASQTDEVTLGALSPAPTGDVLVRYRVQGIAAGGRVTVSMYHGATLVKADTQRTANGDYTMTVTSTDYAGVTDWSNVRLRFVSG